MTTLAPGCSAMPTPYRYPLLQAKSGLTDATNQDVIDQLADVVLNKLKCS
jgi:hypothetical protein